MTRPPSCAIPAAMLDRLEERPILLAILIGIAAQLLFTIGLNRPSILNFDEVHYVTAARVLIALSHAANPEHPLLGKSLIALGMLIFGDNPIGWRALSTLAGTATVVGVYVLTLALTRATRPALFAALFTMLGQMVFVQARIGMLDVFMGAFLVCAAVAFVNAMHGTRRGAAMTSWTVTAALLGASVAVKWAAVPYVAFAAIAFLWLRRGHPDRFGGMPWLTGLAILGGISIPLYFLTFAPAFFYAQNPLTLAKLIPFQLEMWELQTQVLAPHNYQSSWWSWPLMLRPMWYFYEPDQGAVRGVLLIGNPAILWGGLVAVLACWWAGIRQKAGVPLAVAILWTFSLGIWAIIPKSLGFFYYYYLSSIILCIVLAVAFHHWRDSVKQRDDWFLVLCVALFAYFYPTLAALPLASDRGFERWIWIPSWA
ncbi:phospholipid carrier-dependent glycosyltransferase [Sphingomonas sp. MG17]|uniref:Polyprenol-phosphate-mannose--protein mannosyltransferase n=1 Tax=Sphingomonas tagetis TaxID=2949092 RepID=A0A9X2HFC9_9SPHN|nr:phospholipid carrier-dependent glycosyltransferase [Sphingomonas tagetis]MCP3730096.1 phospholipid carrier-dependent glycosyltransferase [Sphingomonas tagetis]